ncbi:MAG: transposase [Epulopiscium sp. Nele67-Bin005]|nr:MAG: transposase [Epulopiscium sp. Nele67-Bin005]
MDKTKVGRGCIYYIQYHIVWCVKFRQQLLVDEVESCLKEIFLKIAQDNNFEIVEINIYQDYIYLVVMCSPQHQIPNLLRALKGISARILFTKCPNLKILLQDAHLWNSSYFVATTSENIKNQIKDYINSQN